MKTILEQLGKDNIGIEKQIDLLAQYLMENFGGPTKSEGAIEMAVRLLEEYRNAKPMPKLKTKGENYDQQQEKHNAYLGAGFKLKESRWKNGLKIRKYEKNNN